MASEWQKLDEGIRARVHPTRKHGVKPDLYFVLRFTVDGQKKQEALGWASEGWTLAKARAELAKLKEAARTGNGPATLQEKRAQAKAAREVERARPTIIRLWTIYREAKGEYSNGPADSSNFQHLAAFYTRQPEAIRTHEVSALAKELETQGKSPQTVQHVLELLRRLINFGARQELCSRPAGLQFIMPKLDNQKTECLTPEQGRALIDALDAAKDQNLASLVRLALATGMRRGALLALQWDDLDFRTGHITLRGESAKSGKTSQIPMTTAARGILEGIERTASPYVFPGKDGGKRVELRRFLNALRKEAGLPADFRPLHGLRHTYASWLASSGKVDLFTLQKLMTHGSPQMTQRYAHLADEAMKRAASVIDECLDLAANAEPARPAGAKVTKFKKS